MWVKQLFLDIQQLITLEAAAKKQGRQIREEDLSVISDGAFLVSEEGRILWTGARKEALKNYSGPDFKMVSLGAQTVLPAFLECHTHSLFAGERFEEFELRLTGVSYEEISRRGGGIQSTVNATRQASSEELKKLLQKRIQNFRKQGVGVVEVKSGYGLSLKEELRLLEVIRSLKDPLVVPTFLGPHSASPETPNLDEYMEDLIRKGLPEVSKRSLAHRVDIFIEKGFFTLEQAERYFKAATDMGFQVAAHVEQLSRQGGADLARKFKALSVDHCVNLSDEDIQELSNSSTTSVLLPSADLYLNVDYPPARKLIDQGARVALSTDFNPGSSPSQSLELCSLLARLKMKMTLPEIFSAWTVGAAFALGLEKDRGNLEVGKFADFQVWDKPWSSFFYNFEEIHPRDLYLSGKSVAIS